MNFNTRSRLRLRQGDVVEDEFHTPWELSEKLGQGGQGEVWSVTGGRAAVKFLKRSREVDEEGLRTRLASVRRFDLSGIPIAKPLTMLAGEHLGYTMELLGDMVGVGTLATVSSSEPVRDWFQRTGGLRRRLRLLALAAEALSHLHDRALSYGDVSPTNIRVSANSGHDQVWLIDPDNIAAESSPFRSRVHTFRYGAPEVAAERASCSSLTDVYSFGVLAFETLVLAHPFVGDMVYEDPSAFEYEAFTGRLPWIDHATDTRNRSARGLSRRLVLTKGLNELAGRTFDAGLNEPRARPSMHEWHAKLDRAERATIVCPACDNSYYAFSALCPWCDTGRPAIIQCEIRGYVPSTCLPGMKDGRGAETGPLDSLFLTPHVPVVIRARNGMICLDPGPAEPSVNPDEPLVKIVWDGGSQLLVHGTGRHDIRLFDSTTGRSFPVEAHQERALTLGRSDVTIRFGPHDLIHRFARFLVQRKAGQ
ncbi:protein kinase domain-containing protein [Streptosporangium canum]|uniref:protein kinase domain-containing protein n=1 Tax=Streptosporangium canum TaxID=324952 RepID=UPI00378CB212